MTANSILTHRTPVFPYPIVNDLRSSIQLEERKKIGQELHDNVNQILSTVKLFADMLNPGDERDKDIRNKIKEYILLAVSEIRTLSGEMVRGKNKFNGLIDEIKKIVDNIRFTTSVQTSFSYDSGIESFSQEKKICLLRIVQEQLKNVLHYSAANKVTIDLQREDKMAVLVIADNGRGFDTTKKRKGIGLKNIYDRTHAYKGTVSLESSPGKGCRLEIRLPFK